MTTLGLLGDVHADSNFLRFACWVFARQGVTEIHQMGDFGIGFKSGYHERAQDICEKYDVKIFVTPGNHEDYDIINSLPLNEEGVQPLTDDIFLLPRGYTWKVDGHKFLSFGGAPSVDRLWRAGSKEKIWWMEEVPTGEELERVAVEENVDVMFAHDAPFSPTIDKHIDGNPQGFHIADIQYAYNFRVKLDKVVRQIAPKIYAHGHYHIRVEDVLDYGTQMVGLGANTRTYGDSMAFLDTENLEVTRLNRYDVFALHELYVKMKGNV